LTCCRLQVKTRMLSLESCLHRRSHEDFKTMPLVQEVRHPKSLDFKNERKAVLLRETGRTWDHIRGQVRNRQGGLPSVSHLKRVCKGFSHKSGQRVYNYQNCGQKPTKVTKTVEKFLVQRLLALRLLCTCTATTLQREVLAAKCVSLDVSTIRKILSKHGFQWLPKAQKRKYSKRRKQERLAFAKAVLRLSTAELREKLSLSMDGVVLAVPPKDATDRANYCAYGAGHMWRKHGEAGAEKLAGDDPYPQQIPQARIVPLWGGLSEGGFSVITFHKKRKLTSEEWCHVVRRGKLTAAIRALEPSKADGPWKVLADNESFLHTAASRRAMADEGITLWRMPPASPDLNPVEKMWAWLRRRLREKDREDLRRKRPVPGLTAFQARVRAVLASAKAQEVASNIAASFRKTCKEVVAKKGGMARG